MEPCRLGVLALGDSITNGHGGMQSGLGSQSWAQWLAQALELPFTKLARDGATARDVVTEQLPAIRGERYDVGCVYVGVNDARSADWDAGAYERDLDAILRALAERCDRVVVLTLPLRLGIPPAGADLPSVNAAIVRLARGRGAVVADLSDFAGAAWVWADRVHATATGQVEIADRAARALGAERLPSAIADPRRPDLAYRRHYAQRALREHARGAWLRLRARAARRR
ncbi:MAG TPA: GDSL-type esterase/lipase family protein [Solirubrobacteraceae bacterium]|nr:GDSL-type esterase/lipase family protein [Solirubrobacteraceae bacterium]